MSGDCAEGEALGPLTRDEFSKAYTAICRGLDHEAKVSGDRIAWAISMTGGLFAATAVLITIIVLGKPPADTIAVLLGFMAGIALVGTLFSVVTGVGVYVAYRQFRYLRNCFRGHQGAFDALSLPRPTGDNRGHGTALVTALAFPVVMFLCWFGEFVVAVGLAVWILGWVPLDQERLYKYWPTLRPQAVSLAPTCCALVDFHSNIITPLSSGTFRTPATRE